MERQSLPNATTSLILGILSVVTCICYGVIGLPLGIIAFVLGNKALKVYHENPKDYKGSGNANAGKKYTTIYIVCLRTKNQKKKTTQIKSLLN